MTTAALIAFGGASAGAFAQEPETPATSVEQTPSNQPSEPATPPTTPSTTPPSTPDPAPSTEPVPPSTPATEPSVPPSQAPVPPGTTPDLPSTPDTKPEETPPPPQDGWEGGPSRPDLSVQLTFGRAEYRPGEDVDATLVVRNSGAAPAAGIRLSHHVQDAWIVSGADELGSRPSLRPAEQKVINLKLRPKWDWSKDVRVEFRATVDGVADPTPGDNGVTGSVKIRQEVGTAGGLLYVDKNGNGSPDLNEDLDNTYVYVRGGTPQVTRSVLSSAVGELRFGDLPVGEYVVTQLYSGSNTYVIDPAHSTFVVENGKHTTVTLPAVPAVDSVLGATMAFGKSTYHRDEKLGITVTLTNSGTRPLSGVVAVCEEHSPDYLRSTSPGWGALHPDGAGVVVPAGGSVTVEVTDEVPQNMRYRTVYAFCKFGNNGRNSQGYKSVQGIYASIKGTFGDLSGTLENSENGQKIADTPIAVLDATTRRLLKSIKTDRNGAFLAYDVPVGRVELVVAGRWKSAAPFVVDVLADRSNEVALSVVPGPEVPDLGANVPDLAITAKFEKDSYDVGEPLKLKVVAKHVGTGFALRAQVRSEYVTGEMDYDRKQFGDLGAYPARGVELWPGESREVTLVGQVPYTLTADGQVTLRLVVDSGYLHQDPNLADNVVQPVADVTYPSGDLAVHVYADRNGNGRRDAGEEQGDTPVSTSGGTSSNGYRDGRTDASGRVVFRDLPLGTYRVNAELRDGWVRAVPVEATISAGVETPVEIRGVRPLSDKLPASVRFVQRSYAAGQDYQADVTITNNTGADLPAVKAYCSGPGDAGEIYNSGAGWGDLVWNGAGVPVANGETKTVRVSGEQPKDSPAIGYATIGCSIGPDPHDPGATQAGDEFRVPGQRGVAHLELVRDDPNGGQATPVADMPVVLVDRISLEPVARTVTGADGVFLLRDLPVGRYHVVVPGPWQVEFRHSNPYLHVVNGPSVRQRAYLVPGPEVEDPGYPLPENQAPVARTPVASGGGGEVLAKTGASVLGLGVLGALLVAFGVGASVIGRKRA
ncbi:carboxypeptidase-like regulatory domain-containing protein [Lentzea guizhouensis]|nr:carboxypeptidase-like regulatory domain-containing protein [Lentzea guizhouensis]